MIFLNKDSFLLLFGDVQKGIKLFSPPSYCNFAEEMKIKKRDLRKRLAQLPINYPAPFVANPFDYNSEKNRVEDLCKRLAHNEVEVRDAVLADLPKYLQEVSTSFQLDGNKLEDVELLFLKLCLGIFYCFWHSDKPLVQHNCAYKISQLCLFPTTPLLQDLFFNCLLRILAREWSRIDHYRLDKYMALVRKCWFQCLVQIRKRGEHCPPPPLASSSKRKKAITDISTTSISVDLKEQQESIDRIVDCVHQHVFKNPNCVGLTMHLVDVCFDEMCRSELPTNLFVTISKRVPLFAMSLGNFVEKRTLDNFITPIVVGQVEQRNKGVQDVNDLLSQLVVICQEYSISRQTQYKVRPMFAESQFLLQQALELRQFPQNFVSARVRDIRKELAREVDELRQTKLSTISLKRVKKMNRIYEKVRSEKKKSSESDPKKVPSKAAKKPLPKNTKRKKHYRLTESDLTEE